MLQSGSERQRGRGGRLQAGSRKENYNRAHMSSRGDAGPIERLLTTDARMSQIVKYGGVVFVTGQTSRAADVTLQTAEVLAKIDKLLGAFFQAGDFAV